MECAPAKENKNGLVMEIEDDHAGEKFTWNLLLVCGDPAEAATYFGGFDKEKVSPFPARITPALITTYLRFHHGNATAQRCLYAVTTEGENRGELKCFLTVPANAETCGSDFCARMSVMGQCSAPRRVR